MTLLKHDAQLDYYGRRLATASSDRTIRLFQVEPNQPEKFLCALSGHEGPVWQVAWAHPKFGSLLASCSYDGSVVIWKESGEQGASWIKAKEHKLHESSVNALSWAPPEYGLALACASSDGKVSILTYHGEEAKWDVQVWAAHQIGCNAISWCPSPHPASLITALAPTSKEESPSHVNFAERRIVTGGCDNLVKIWRFVDGQGWHLDGEPLAGHSDWVRDVVWGPNIGVPMQTIISCSQDRTVLVWKSANGAAGTWSKRPLSKEPFADTLWRVSFSPAGNLLAVASGDNHITLWRENLDGEWECVSDVDQATLANK